MLSQLVLPREVVIAHGCGSRSFVCRGLCSLSPSSSGFLLCDYAYPGDWFGAMMLAEAVEHGWGDMAGDRRFLHNFHDPLTY